MPVRTVGSNSTEERGENLQGKYTDIIDLNWLPDKYIKRIDDTFDAYFKLGMKKSKVMMSGSESPRFVSDMATMSSPDLGNKLGEYTAWFSYASDKFKYLLVACTFIENEMAKVMDSVVGGMVEGKGNIDAKKAKARSTPEYIMLGSYHQKLEGMKIMMDNELKNYDKCIQTLSREVSRRENNGGF